MNNYSAQQEKYVFTHLHYVCLSYVSLAARNDWQLLSQNSPLFGGDILSSVCASDISCPNLSGRPSPLPPSPTPSLPPCLLSPPFLCMCTHVCTALKVKDNVQLYFLFSLTPPSPPPSFYQTELSPRLVFCNGPLIPATGKAEAGKFKAWLDFRVT